ncbi:SIS domain-containing protein [Rhodobacter sp. KR11]|jgi:6-phospho-3-hexuloisomerase|uniref:SIS domain-containing protein n=1 Tax=Rhodobacter sp. KR11 TaxID=2974588 RepID=UPI0022217CC1|nr:SIS domain-containing protein [Rhodobacter sp. KR11]MCW1919305.1 SIS domain-containing protein [Rhodobacter sp. KR11]
MSLPDLATAAALELAQGAAAISAADFRILTETIASARKIVVYGCGREGLMMRALAMRLYHLGCDVHVQGDMSCPPVGRGDLLFVASGPGRLATVNALIAQARGAGAKVACITAEPDGPDARAADVRMVIPVQTMARDQSAPSSILPMGSVFEGTMFLAFELLVLTLRDRLQQGADQMRARHTNME